MELVCQRVAPAQLAEGQMFVAAAIEPVHAELAARFEQARGLDDAAKGIAVGPRVGRVDEPRAGPALARLAIGRPSCRGRACADVLIMVGAGTLTKKK